MSTKQLVTFVTVITCVLLGAMAQFAVAQPDEPFRARNFDYGSRFELPDGQQAEIWNPAKRKLVAGGPMIGGYGPRR